MSQLCAWTAAGKPNSIMAEFEMDAWILIISEVIQIDAKETIDAADILEKPLAIEEGK